MVLIGPPEGGWTASNLAFFLVRLAKRAGHANDHVRGLKGRDGRCFPRFSLDARASVNSSH